MLIAFLIWSAVSVLFAVIGISSRRSDKAAGFWANAEAPEVSDIRGYNRAVSKIWFIAAGVMEAAGVPLLFLKQNDPGFIVTVLLVVALVIGMMVAYNKVEEKYRK